MSLTREQLNQSLRYQLQQGRSQWTRDYEQAVMRIQRFAASLADAIGSDISRDEAVTALKAFADEEIEKLR